MVTFPAPEENLPHPPPPPEGPSRTDHLQLRWEETDDDYLELFVGSLRRSVATLSKRKKWWDATIELPGIRPRREFDTLDNQRADVEALVRHWFLLATAGVLS